MASDSSIFINPLTDFGFKYLLGNEANRDLTISFLNAVIGGESPIISVEFVDKEHKGFSKDDRALIYDVHCKLEDGSKIIVEMQNRYQAHFDDRALYYLAADLHAQGKKGDIWDYSLTPVYGIFLMNFEWKGEENPEIREDVYLYSHQKKRIFSNKLAMTFIKLPMMVKSEEECANSYDRWLYILKNMDKMDAIPRSFMQHDPIFKRLGKVARVGALSDKERKAYDESLKIYRDNYAIMQTERAEGMAEGMAKGMVKGRAEGLAEGLAEGREEERKILLEAAHKAGLSDEMIDRIFNSTH